jgi:hypothetical protein
MVVKKRLSGGSVALFVAGLVLAAFASCSGKTIQSGGLELLITTSGIQAGRDFDTVEVLVRQETSPGGPWHTVIDVPRTVPSEVNLPTTVSVQAGTSPDQEALIEVTALKMGTAIVQRGAQLQIPSDRIAELPIILSALCVGKVTTCSMGSCEPDTGRCGSIVVNPTTLSNFRPGDENHLDASIASIDAGSEGPIAEGSAGDTARIDAQQSQEGAVEAGGTDEASTQALELPLFNPTLATQNNDFRLALTSSPGATICYTLDGQTVPACNASALCTGGAQAYSAAQGIAIDGTVTDAATGKVTVQAIACAQGQVPTAPASQTYTLAAAPPAMTSPAPGTVSYVSGGRTPTIASATSGADIHYTLNGASPPTCTTGTTAANGATIAVTSSATIQAMACKAGYAPSSVSPSAYTVQLNAPAFPSSGTSGAPGTYDATVPAFDFNVSANGGASPWVCYTTDGSPPMCSTTSDLCSAGTSAIGPSFQTSAGISQTGAVVNATACALGYDASIAASGSYVLKADPVALNPPGVSGTTPLTSFAIPANMVGSLQPTVEQTGSGAALSFVCVMKNGTPACSASSCASGTNLSLGAKLPTTVSPGDTWSTIGCGPVGFQPSDVTTVAYAPSPAAAAPSLVPSGGTFTGGVTPSVVNNDIQTVIVCYTTNGSTPTCASGSTCGSGAQVVSLAGAGSASVNSLVVTNGGSGYTSAIVTISPPGAGTTATAIASITSGHVTSLTLTNGGSGYSTAPTVTISGGGGSGAAAVTTISSQASLSSLGTGTTTVKAIACDPSEAPSFTVQATYIVQ